MQVPLSKTGYPNAFSSPSWRWEGSDEKGKIKTRRNEGKNKKVDQFQQNGGEKNQRADYNSLQRERGRERQERKRERDKERRGDIDNETE
jgi:hypothetical protein